MITAARVEQFRAADATVVINLINAFVRKLLQKQLWKITYNVL